MGLATPFPGQVAAAEGSEMKRQRAWRMRAITLAGLTGLLLGATSAEPRAVLVATASLAPGPYDVTLPDKLGVLEAAEHLVLGFEIPGRLEQLASEGRTVGAGEEIAQLDAALERARVRQAELHLRDARSQLQRVEGLKRSEAASEKTHEDARTAVDLRLGGVRCRPASSSSARPCAPPSTA